MYWLPCCLISISFLLLKKCNISNLMSTKVEFSASCLLQVSNLFVIILITWPELTLHLIYLSAIIIYFNGRSPAEHLSTQYIYQHSKLLEPVIQGSTGHHVRSGSPADFESPDCPETRRFPQWTRHFNQYIKNSKKMFSNFFYKSYISLLILSMSIFTPNFCQGNLYHEN